MAIFFAALTPGMVQVAEQVSRELNLSFPIETVTFDKGPDAVRDNPQADVLISRGLMVDLMRKHTDRPVVGLTLAIDDMLKAVNELEAGGASKVGVVAHKGFLEMGDGADLAVGGVAIYVRPWSTLEDIPRILDSLGQIGVNAIAGDKGGGTAAKERGYAVVAMESGILSARRAINEALKIAQAQKREREKEQLKTRGFEQLISEHYTDLEQATAAVQELAASSEELAASSQESSAKAKTAVQEVKGIAEVLDVIRWVAQQSNMLGLNAAIEAARAGDQGRGFSVVAEEVRKLAAESHKAARNIDAMLKKIRESVDSVQQNVEQSQVITQEQANAAQVLSQKLDGLRMVGEKLKKLTVA